MLFSPFFPPGDSIHTKPEVLLHQNHDEGTGKRLLFACLRCRQSKGLNSSLDMLFLLLVNSFFIWKRGLGAHSMPALGELPGGAPGCSEETLITVRTQGA